MDFSFRIRENNGNLIAELDPACGIIQDIEDATDLLGNASFEGAQSVVLQKEQLAPAFFELRTGLAGAILQKFSNYRMKLAICGDFENITSKALQDFIRESNRTGKIIFVASADEAMERFQQ